MTTLRKDGRGGKRSRHVPKALNYDQVRTVRAQRALGVPFKTLMREHGVSRNVLDQAVHGRGCYAGVQG